MAGLIVAQYAETSRKCCDLRIPDRQVGEKRVAENKPRCRVALGRNRFGVQVVAVARYAQVRRVGKEPRRSRCLTSPPVFRIVDRIKS
jgi:hypothetical protein